MAGETQGPRHAAESSGLRLPSPIWLVAILAMVLAVIFLSIAWRPRTSTPAASGPTEASAPASGSQNCAGKGAPIAVAASHADTLQAVADAYNAQVGRCAVHVTTYTTPASLADVQSATAVIGSSSVAELASGLGSELSDKGTIAQVVGVVAVPEPLVTPLGWTQAPDWKQLMQTLPNGSHWDATGHGDLGRFNIGMVAMDSCQATKAFGLGLVGAALNKSPSDIKPQDLMAPQALAPFLGMAQQATLTSTDQAALVNELRKADEAGNLPKTVSAVLMDEHGVFAYNSASPKTPLTAFYPAGTGITAQLRYLTTSNAGSDVIGFGDFLAGTAGQEALKKAGLRGADGTADPALSTMLKAVGEPQASGIVVTDDLGKALDGAWQRLQHPGRFLVLLDVSGSMKDPVGDTGRTKLQYAQEAAATGMKLVPPAAEIGLWEFSDKLEGNVDYRELIPVAPVQKLEDGKTHLDSLITSLNALTPKNDTGLYDSALAGFRKMKETYTVGQPNVVVLLTDGRNEDQNGIDLDELISTLKSEQDPNKPVRFLTLAYGADADVGALKQIADATGGSAYESPNPEDIGSVFFQALMNG